MTEDIVNMSYRKLTTGEIDLIKPVIGITIDF